MICLQLAHLRVFQIIFVGKDIPQKVIVGAFPQAFSVEHKRAFHAGCSAHGSASQVLFTLLSIEQGVLWFSGTFKLLSIEQGVLWFSGIKRQGKFHRVLYSCRSKDNPRWTKRKVIALLKINVSSSNCDNCSISVFSPFWKSLLEYSPGWLMRLFFTCSNL